MKPLVIVAIASLAFWGSSVAAQRQNPPAPATAKPGVTIETEKGTFEIEFFNTEAPKSVDHLMALFKRGFYRGLRFHRVEASLVQVGDPQTRNMTLQNAWGSGNSGEAIGVAEISKTRKHVRGTVALANTGDAKYSDSQIYIMKTASPSLDGKYTIVGQVVKGMDVVDKIQKGDAIKLATIKGAPPK